MPIPRLALLASFALTLAAPLVPALVVPTLAQVPPMHGPHDRGMRPRTGGEFTDAQKARIKAVLVSASRRGQSIRADTSLTPSARTAKMRTLQQSVRMQMMAILSPAQRARFQAATQHSVR